MAFTPPALGAGCASPVGHAGDLMYNAGTYHVPQYCDGTNWIPLGKVPGAGGGGCSNPAFSEGNIMYNSDYHVLQYCDGTTWRIAGGNTPITGLVGWWNFDEGSGTSAADSSGGGNTGTLYNAPTWTGGKLNGALTLNGSTQYVNVPDATSLELSGSWTVSAWVNPAGFPTSGNNTKLITRDDSGANTNYGIAVDNNQNCGGLGWKVYFNNTAGSAYYACYVTTINTGTWYLVTGVWDSSAQNEYLYLNGALVATQNQAGNVPTSNTGGSLELGNEYSLARYLNGTIDDARVYNRALSASEVWRLYNGAP
jgi:hypothetical protein